MFATASSSSSKFTTDALPPTLHQAVPQTLQQTAQAANPTSAIATKPAAAVPSWMTLSLISPVRLSPYETLCVYDAPTLTRLFDPTRTDAVFLFDTPVGEIQRNLDTEHLSELVTFQTSYREAHASYSFPTNIVVAEHDGRIALVDGQHRLEALRYLENRVKGENATGEATVFAETRVPVLVRRLSTPSEYDEVFVAVNKNKPVPLYTHVDGWKSVLKGVERHFRTTYASYIREKSDHPRVPHINVTRLLAYLDEGDYARKLGLSCEAFVREIEELNALYVLHWRRLIPKKYVDRIADWAPRCLARQPSRPLMLQLFQRYEWVDRILLRVTQPAKYPSYEQMVHTTVNHRVPIPVLLRQQVWRKRNPQEGGFVGRCYVCERAMNYSDMQCGHVVSVFAGGNTNVSNLEPVCGVCNRDMGVQELEAYRAVYWRERGGRSTPSPTPV